MKIGIFDLNDCPYSSRNGSYGGVAGDKDGILFRDENWIVKYPKTNVGMSKASKLAKISYGPLSEFLGSHIYKILGYDVHETILGIRKNFLVVACKDFCQGETRLHEIRTVKNVHVGAADKKLDRFHYDIPISLLLSIMLL